MGTPVAFAFLNLVTQLEWSHPPQRPAANLRVISHSVSGLSTRFAFWRKANQSVTMLTLSCQKQEPESAKRPFRSLSIYTTVTFLRACVFTSVSIFARTGLNMIWLKYWIFLPSPPSNLVNLPWIKKKEKKCLKGHHIFVFLLIKVLNISFVAYWIKSA